MSTTQVMTPAETLLNKILMFRPSTESAYHLILKKEEDATILKLHHKDRGAPGVIIKKKIPNNLIPVNLPIEKI